MMSEKRRSSLEQILHSDTEALEYLNEIYEDLLYNRAVQFFEDDTPLRQINVKHAIRFADILSRSRFGAEAEKDRILSQEIMVLLRTIYPDSELIRYFLGTVLSEMGNYRGTGSEMTGKFESADLFDRIYYAFDRNDHLVPGKANEYFTDDQVALYKDLDSQYLSFSGVKGFGKSFTVKTYIACSIKNGSEKNFAYIVPSQTEVKNTYTDLVQDLQTELRKRQYHIVTMNESSALMTDDHFIFVMTPERFLNLLIEHGEIPIDFVFVDDAQKISERGMRSAYYYKVISQVCRQNGTTRFFFASSSVRNPDIYLTLIPGIENKESHETVSEFVSAVRIRYYVDFSEHKAYYYNKRTKEIHFFKEIPLDTDLNKLIILTGSSKKNIVYFAGKDNMIRQAISYAENLPETEAPQLEALAAKIRKEIHPEYCLAQLIVKGVAFIFAALPDNIRMRIREEFDNGSLHTIFCTSTIIDDPNLAADNLFITSYRNSTSNMGGVEFCNLAGHAGRIKKSLCGNVVFIRMDEKKPLKKETYQRMLGLDTVQNADKAVDLEKNRKNFPKVIEDLKEGDIQLKRCQEERRKGKISDQDYKALRAFALIYIRDIAQNETTPVTQAFEKYVEAGEKFMIRERFSVYKTSDDITFSHDQIEALHTAVKEGLSYPALTGDQNTDIQIFSDFYVRLGKIFNWETYERNTLGKIVDDQINMTIRRYTNALLPWMNGCELSEIIAFWLKYKESITSDGIQSGNYMIKKDFNREAISDLNQAINESLEMTGYAVSNTARYLRRFSAEYKTVHHLECIENDWFEFVNYGTTDTDNIWLQKNGFSRNAAIFMLKPENRDKYLIITDETAKVNRQILSCENNEIREEAKIIFYYNRDIFAD